MFENLSERLERSLKILKGEGRITEVNALTFLPDFCSAVSAARGFDTRNGIKWEIVRSSVTLATDQNPIL